MPTILPVVSTMEGTISSEWAREDIGRVLGMLPLPDSVVTVIRLGIMPVNTRLQLTDLPDF